MFTLPPSCILRSPTGDKSWYLCQGKFATIYIQPSTWGNQQGEFPLLHQLVNNSKQYHKHELHEILVKLHIKNTPNGVTVKKIQATQVMNTICQHQVAHLRAMEQHATDCKHTQR